MKLYVLMQSMVYREDMSYAQILDVIDNEDVWYSQSMSLVEGGGSRQLVESHIAKTIIMDGEIWTDAEVSSFATTRFLGKHVLELSEEVGNAIIARIKGNTISFAPEEPDDS